MNTYDHPKDTFAPTKILFPQTRVAVDPDNLDEDLRDCIDKGIVAVYDHDAYSTMLGMWFSAIGEN